MAVYVDDMYKSPMGKFGRMKMSHMVADTLDELNAMADKIGIARKWIQQSELGQGWVHYDVALSARTKAIEHGAIPITLRELSMKCMGWKKERAGARKMELDRLVKNIV